MEYYYNCKPDYRHTREDGSIIYVPFAPTFPDFIGDPEEPHRFLYHRQKMFNNMLDFMASSRSYLRRIKQMDLLESVDLPPIKECIENMDKTREALRDAFNVLGNKNSTKACTIRHKRPVVEYGHNSDDYEYVYERHNVDNEGPCNGRCIPERLDVMIEWELSRISDSCDPCGIKSGEFEDEMGFVSDSDVDNSEDEL